KARYFADDLHRFLDDLSNGVPISIIAAPSIRTNIPDYKKLFTFLKSRGVKTIYDVSVGADICIWAYIKSIEKSIADSGKISPIITQPCPVIVAYCELFRHDLIPRLSRVHSPMACTSIYMKKYKGIGDSIAAISPCIAKSREFHDTKLADYNLTFTNILDYIKDNNIILPNEETEYDNDESGLGALFPVPGGLKENIEFYLGKKIHIETAQGFHIFDKLNEYANTPQKLLPDIFDILNCIEGCNVGPAYSHDKNIFEVGKKIHDQRLRVIEKTKEEYARTVFKSYDDTLNYSHFLRDYKTIFTEFPKITEEDIELAFERLGKQTFEKQNIDCGACGSETCIHMAKKIVLNINIASNCIFRAMEEAKTEHEDNRRTHVREMNISLEKEKNELQLAKLNAVVKATKIGLWEVTLVNNDPFNPGNVFFWSDEFRYMLGYESIEDFPDTFEAWADKLHPEDKEEAFKKVKEHINDKTGKTLYDVEYRLLCKNGEYSYFHACGESVRDKEGNSIRVAGAVMDITESKKALLSKDKQRIQAEEASKAKTIFLSNMSHEIRTPLNAIIGMTTIGKMSDSAQKKDISFGKIEGASKHLLGIINDILDMSKIEANKLELSLVNFELEKMIQKVVDILQPRIDEKRQDFGVYIEKEIPETLIGDDQRLSQVIANLLSNAIKFTPEEGSIRLDARLISEKDGMCRLLICVSDTGIGISTEQKERLFESFEQADARIARNFGGTGLGLPISKRIVEMMGGELCVDSEPGNGAAFVFNILLKRGERIEENDKETVTVDYGGIFKGKTIMLAEDVDINREIVISLLETTEVQIECAENGAAAVTMYTQAPDKYNLIFMDIQMPEMDGYEATRLIREFESAIPNAGRIPIIAMTANVFKEDVERCLGAGMDGHLRKPLDYEELIGLLKQYI
ncbi:MAG: ATP-binding protein, partial [Treponema sp.]|nr:ATP-binding protein [Treponema sp.]